MQKKVVLDEVFSDSGDEREDSYKTDGPIDIVIDCACALLDIPINNRVHALHQLLTLYQERFQVNISAVLVTEHKIEPNKGCKRDIMIF